MVELRHPQSPPDTSHPFRRGPISSSQFSSASTYSPATDASFTTTSTAAPLGIGTSPMFPDAQLDALVKQGNAKPVLNKSNKNHHPLQKAQRNRNSNDESDINRFSKHRNYHSSNSQRNISHPYPSKYPCDEYRVESDPREIQTSQYRSNSSSGITSETCSSSHRHSPTDDYNSDRMPIQAQHLHHFSTCHDSLVKNENVLSQANIFLPNTADNISMISFHDRSPPKYRTMDEYNATSRSSAHKAQRSQEYSIDNVKTNIDHNSPERRKHMSNSTDNRLGNNLTYDYSRPSRDTPHHMNYPQDFLFSNSSRIRSDVKTIGPTPHNYNYHYPPDTVVPSSRHHHV